jgi:hypothetical protein
MAVSRPSSAAGNGNGSGTDFSPRDSCQLSVQSSVAKAYCEMSRRDDATVAWHEVPGRAPPQKSRPLGYGVIREEGERKLQGVEGHRHWR